MTYPTGFQLKYGYSTYNGQFNRVDNAAAGAHYKKETKGTLTTHHHYLYAGGVMIGEYLSKSDSTVATRYFYRDHLGSIVRVADQTGALIECLSYDAWGARRRCLVAGGNTSKLIGTAAVAPSAVNLTTERQQTPICQARLRRPPLLQPRRQPRLHPPWGVPSTPR